MADVPAWHAKGEWFDVCRWQPSPAPVLGAQPPDDDYCDGVLVWHIREGRYGDVALDGRTSSHLSVSRATSWEGAHSEPKMGVVMDERADEGQREALPMIFGGQAGGWPARLNKTFGPEMLGLEFAPIEVGDRSRPNLLAHSHSWSRACRGQGPVRPNERRQATSDGEPSRVRDGTPTVGTQGKETEDNVNAFAFKWDRAGNSSKHITFDWSGIPTRHDHRGSISMQGRKPSGNLG